MGKTGGKIRSRRVVDVDCRAENSARHGLRKVEENESCDIRRRIPTFAADWIEQCPRAGRGRGENASTYRAERGEKEGRAGGSLGGRVD